jgi:hypothetical protein
MSQYLFFLLILACPLMMIFMMRGGHGHGAHGGHGGPGSRTESANSSHDGCEHDERSIDELKRQRADIDRTIAEREAAEYGDRTLEPTR